MSDLSQEETQLYRNEVKLYFDGLRLIWRDIIQKNLKYMKPNLVNTAYKQELDNQNFPLFVFPTFMRSGKQYYIVKHKSQITG